MACRMVAAMVIRNIVIEGSTGRGILFFKKRQMVNGRNLGRGLAYPTLGLLKITRNKAGWLLLLHRRGHKPLSMQRSLDQWIWALSEKNRSTSDLFQVQRGHSPICKCSDQIGQCLSEPLHPLHNRLCLGGKGKTHELIAPESSAWYRREQRLFQQIIRHGHRAVDFHSFC
jgi:hypothetical protein